MTESLHTCETCGRTNFTARGLKAHRCRPAQGRSLVDTAAPAEPGEHPAFATARRHAEAISGGVKLTVAGCIALGLELNKIKAELGYAHGGNRGASSRNTNLKWPDLVAQETGFSYDRCNYFAKTAEKVREKILARKTKATAPVRAILQAPPAEWSHDDYLAFADHLGEHFAAETFRGLMLDIGLIAPPEPPAPADPSAPPLVQGDFYHDMLAAHDCVAEPILGLYRTARDPAQFVRYLFELPVEDLDRDTDSGRPPITGLRTLRHIITQAGEEIDRAISAKAKAARGTVSAS